MEHITMLQQAALVVGNTFIFAKTIQAIWHHHVIKRISFTLSMIGVIISVAAVTSAVFGLFLFNYSSNDQQKEDIARRFFARLKDGAVLAIISGTSITLI